MYDSGKPESFDRFEKDDLIMPHSLVESCLSKALTAKLRICFGHMKKFKAFPCPVVFLMTLDICIEGAKTSLYALSLLSYHGENVTECVTEAQRLVKIMQSGYALPVSTGSMLLNKFTSTSSEFFNRSVPICKTK